VKQQIMKTQTITVRVAPELYEEITRLSKTYRKTQSAVARVLIEEALAQRAEDMTASQFQLVENRLAYIERRFSGWMVKLSRAIAESLFYSEQMATFDLESNDKKVVEDAAQKFVRQFMQFKHEDPAKASGEAGLQ
jgi:predicted DNA-binding protein